MSYQIFVCGHALRNIIQMSKDDQRAYGLVISVVLRRRTSKKKCDAFEVDTHEPYEERMKNKLRVDIFKTLEDYAIHLFSEEK